MAFPNDFSQFIPKINFPDPNADEIRAEHINDLQDAVSSLENVLGLNVQGNSNDVNERITSLENFTGKSEFLDYFLSFNLIANPRFKRDIIRGIGISTIFPLRNWVDTTNEQTNIQIVLDSEIDEALEMIG